MKNEIARILPVQPIISINYNQNKQNGKSREEFKRKLKNIENEILIKLKSESDEINSTVSKESQFDEQTFMSAEELFRIHQMQAYKSRH